MKFTRYKIEELGAGFRANTRKEYDNITAVTGPHGYGKSHFSLELAMAIKPAFSLKDDILYFVGGDELDKKYITSRRDVIIVDEATKSAHKYDWMSTDSKKLKTDFDANRMYENTVIFNMPNFNDFSAYFKKTRLMYWFHIIERGWAIFFKKVNNPFGTDCWYLREGEELFLKMPKDLRTPESKIEYWSRHPCFQGYVRFDALPEPLAAEYLMYKLQSRQDAKEGKDSHVFDGLDKHGVRANMRLALLIEALRRYNPALTWKELAEFFEEKKPNTINDWHLRVLKANMGIGQRLSLYDISKLFGGKIPQNKGDLT